MATPTTPLVELDGLGVHLGGRPVLQDLRGALRGRAIGLLGPNGAGKTTLLHTLLGFHAPSAGTARVLGLDVRRETLAIRALSGYMPEGDAFIPGMNAVRFVRMMAELSGLPPGDALERTHEVLWYVGLGEARYRKLETFSLGMKQMAKLAQALAHGPRLLLLDEPTNGLDPKARARMLRLVREIRDAGEVRILFSSHLLRDVEEVCDEVLVLHRGKIAAVVDLNAERDDDHRFLELETRGPGEAFVRAAAEIGCELARTARDRIRMILPDGVEVADLYRIAGLHDTQIRRLARRRDTLQEIFLQAVEGTNGRL